MADRQSGSSTVTAAETSASRDGSVAVSREQLIELLNQDLAREYQAIIAYVVYSQTLKGAAYMNIAEELETHASEELEHALIISKQIDYLGGKPTVVPMAVRTSDNNEEMLRFDLDNENETVRNYRQRVRPVRGARRVRAGRADPRDPGAGARTPDRPGHRAGDRRPGRHGPEGVRRPGPGLIIESKPGDA